MRVFVVLILVTLSLFQCSRLFALLAIFHNVTVFFYFYGRSYLKPIIEAPRNALDVSLETLFDVQGNHSSFHGHCSHYISPGR